MLGGVKFIRLKRSFKVNRLNAYLMNDVIKWVALVPIARSSNIVTNRSFYAQSNLINNIERCYILGLRSFSCTYLDE